MRLPLSRSDADPAPAGDDAVQQARTRARRRLVGALVLLVAGVIGFPLLFETQPRPLPVDTPIVTPQREPALPARTSPLPRAVPPADAGHEAPQTVASGRVVEPPAPVPAPVQPAAVAEAKLPAAEAKPPAAEPKAPAAPALRPAPAVPAPKPVAAAPQPAPAPAASHAAGRFVVQVGAYTDAGTLREARAKAERLGLKTYTQVIEADSGKRTRVRVGPFATREEAAAAAGKLKGAGLPANILAL